MSGKQVYSINVLFDGYSRVDGDDMLASGTCTLIKGPVNIIVDTMTPWDGDKLKSSLQTHGLSCQDIHYVINTHGHSDHIGCNYLFPNAIHITGFCISHKDRYFNHDFKSGLEYKINENIVVIPTPGHTLQDVSVLVTTNETVYAITGDLFEREEDLGDDSIWKAAGSDSEELQDINRRKILRIADYVIPGHGSMFEIKKTTIS